MSEQTIILCEGYYDRAFLKAWLLRRGCQDLSSDKRVVDPWGVPVTKGQFGLTSASKHFIRLRPCSGKSRVLPILTDELMQRATRPLRRIVVCLDLDVSQAEDEPNEIASLRTNLERAAQTAVGTPAWEDDELVLQDETTRVSALVWRVLGPVLTGSPVGQTLERLVCTAIASAYPERAQAVTKWLASRADPPPQDVKEFAWSYLAGWYASRGCDSFYAAVWDDPRVAAELERLLTASGAAAIIDRVVL